MNTGRSHANVLKVIPHGESDRIITLYSPDLGKITAIAKGALRSKRRFVNKLEPFSLLRITYRPPGQGSLYFLSEASLLNAYLSLRSVYPCYVAAVLVNELVDLFSSDHDPDPSLFTLLNQALEALDRGSTPAVVLTVFLLRLLGICGYQPQLGRCSVCSTAVRQSRSQAFTLYPGNGTLICNSCRPADGPSQLNMTKQTVLVLQAVQQPDPDGRHKVTLTDTVTGEALATLHRYSRHLLQRDIHSWQQFIQTISMQ